MNFCDVDLNFLLTLEGSCDDCPLKGKEKEIYAIGDIVPQKLCPFAYYSIVPYWVSFIQGAWFRWRQNKEDVVCQCPRPQGVIFLVKRVVRKNRRGIEATVTGIGAPPCSYQHSVGQVFKIEPALCPALFPSLWAQLDVLIEPTSKEIEVECCIAPVSVHVCKIWRKE